MMFFELPAPPHPRHAADLTSLRSLIFGILPKLDFDVEGDHCLGVEEQTHKENVCLQGPAIDKIPSAKASQNPQKGIPALEGALRQVESLKISEVSENAFVPQDRIPFSFDSKIKLNRLPIEGLTDVEASVFKSDHNKRQTEPESNSIDPRDTNVSSEMDRVGDEAFLSAPLSPTVSETSHNGEGMTTPTASQCSDETTPYILVESPAPIQIKPQERPFPDSPALFDVDKRTDSDTDCLETTIIFRTSDQDDINDQLNDVIDIMREDEIEESLNSEIVMEQKEIVDHSDPPASPPVLQIHMPTESVGASILPAFHPLASPTSSAKAVPVPTNSEGVIPIERSPLKRTLTLREQFQALQRITMAEINREFSDERLQFASLLHSIREKSVSLDTLCCQIVEFASSFQKIVEIAYNQFSSLKKFSGNGRRGSITSESACLFSVHAFWAEVQKFGATENQHWVELLAKFRSVCLVPLCVDIQEIRNQIFSFFSEADCLDALIQQAETAHVASVQQFQQLTQKRSLACQKLSSKKVQVISRSSKASSAPATVDPLNVSNEFENEFLSAEIQRLAAEEQLRVYAEIWKTRLPVIISECRELSKKRMTALHAALIALLDFKNSIFSDTLCNVSQLRLLATEQLQLDDDLEVFNEPIFSSGESSQSCSRPSASAHEDDDMSSEDVAAVILNYYLSSNRPRSFVIDMWGTEGFRRTYDFLHSSKSILSQVFVVLEGILQAFDSSSKQLLKTISSHQSSSNKYFNNEPIQQSWLSLLDAFIAEADANRNTAKFIKKAVAVLDVIRSEGKQLRVMFNRHRSQMEKQLVNINNEAHQAFEQQKIKASAFLSSKENLNRNLDFNACPDQNEFQPIVDQFLSCQKATLFANNEVSRVQRQREHLLLKDEVATGVFLRFAQDCMVRHYTTTKRVLQGIYIHLQSQNEASRRCLQRMERMVQTIDTENDLRDFIFSVESKHNAQEKPVEGEELSIKQQLDSTEFDSFHSKSLKGIGSLRFLITLFHEASVIDDGFVRVLRKYPWDFSSLGQSLKYSSLIGAFIQLQKTIECMGNCIDERSSRMKEISKSLKRQKSIIKTNITDIAQQHQSAFKRISSVEANFNNISATYRKAVETMEKISLRNEKDRERERSGHERRQSFIATMIQGRLPARSPRQKMESAVEVAERSQRALDHATVSLKDALSSYTSMKKSHIQSLQNINTTRINAVKWAFTTHCEHQTFYSQQLADFLSGLSISIDRICAETDLNNFVRSNGASSQQPPDRVILSTLDPGNFSRLDTDLSALDSGSFGDTNTTLSVRESTLLDQTIAESDISVDSSYYESNL